MYTMLRIFQPAHQSRNVALITRRTFSHSPSHARGALPVFLSPSSPELSTLLSTMNSQVLLPRHLTKEQSSLVYAQANRAKLESEPIEITLGDVTLPLTHLDRNRLPAQSRTLSEIVKKSESPEDWENVLRVMEGYENAGIKMRYWWPEMIVRQMNKAGMQHLILKALQRANATGLRLREWGVVVEVFRAVRDKAAQADWKKEELVKALRLAEQIVELMEDDEHLGKVTGEKDWRSHPAVVALPLEMAAELAYRHDGDVETVKKYAARLMNALKQRNYFSDTEPNDITHLHSLTKARPADFSKINYQARALTDLAIAMYAQIPIWNSLSTTRTVLDDNMPMAQEAEKVQKAIWKELEEGLKTLDALLVREGKLAADPDKGYAGYVKNAIEQCQDDGEGGETEE